VAGSAAKGTKEVALAKRDGEGDRGGEGLEEKDEAALACKGESSTSSTSNGSECIVGRPDNKTNGNDEAQEKSDDVASALPLEQQAHVCVQIQPRAV
jgi:hypothetical protein